MTFKPKFKAKVDSRENVVAFWLDDSYGDFPGLPEILDPDVRKGFATYTTEQTTILQVCRKTCFCILAHGTPTSLVHLNDQETIGRIVVYHQTYGRARQLLMMSCFTGLSIARTLASSIGVDVIAPGGIGTMTSNGEITCTNQGQSIPENVSVIPLKWVRITPRGETTMSDTHILEPWFVDRSYMPNVDIKR